MSIIPLSAVRAPALVMLLAITQTAGGGIVTDQAPQAPHQPIPQSLLEEHAELDASLKAAARAGGAVGDAARQVLALVEPHMAREEALALAPLRLLPRLAQGEIGPDMADLAATADRLRAERPALLSEHLAIRRALEELWACAWREGKPEYAFLAQRVNRHIAIDEEVLYPAAIVVGDYLRLALPRRQTSASPGAGATAVASRPTALD